MWNGKHVVVGANFLHVTLHVSGDCYIYGPKLMRFDREMIDQRLLFGNAGDSIHSSFVRRDRSCSSRKHFDVKYYLTQKVLSVI